MSCPCTGEFANIYDSINNINNSFNEITGNILLNYNQLTRIAGQQENIYNAIVYGNANISTINANVVGDTFSRTGFVPVCRASISFQRTTVLTVFYSNNCTVARNGPGSYTITLTNPPGNTNYIVSCYANGTGATSVTQAFSGGRLLASVALKTSTQTLIWISNNEVDTAIDPSDICEVQFFW